MVFAEGAAAAGFETFYLLFNPGTEPMQVIGNFFTEPHGVVRKAYTIAPHSRFTVYLNGEVGNIGGVAASFTSLTAVRGRAVDLLGRRPRRGDEYGGRARFGADLDTAGGRRRRPVRDVPAPRQPEQRSVAVDLSVQIEGYGQITLPALAAQDRPGLWPLTIYMPQLLRTWPSPRG